MKTTLGIALCSILASFAAAAQAQDTLRLGNEGNYPPFSITSADGKLSGLEPDLAAAMCKRMGATCDIQAMEFSALLPAMTTGKLDGIVTQLFPKPERLEVSEFTDPILENPMAWAVPAGWDGSVTPEGLDGKTIGTIKGNWAIAPLSTFAPGVDIREYDNINLIILDLKAGRLDAGLAGGLNWITSLIDTEGGDQYRIEATSGAMAEKVEAYSWAFQKGKTELRDTVNTTLGALFADCTYSEIRKQYFSQATSSREPASCL